MTTPALSTTSMTGLRKAAILLVRMGKEYSTRVLANMKENEVEEISARAGLSRVRVDGRHMRKHLRAVEADPAEGRERDCAGSGRPRGVIAHSR